MNITAIWIIIAAAVVLTLMIVIIVLIVTMQNNIQNNVQNSIRNMGNMIYRSQQEAAGSQNSQLAEMNRSLNDAMAGVSKSLGEMQNLSSGVDDLKKILSNVKSRGVMGELQLEAIIEDILSPGQYEKNVAVKGGSERVEFAVKFPGDNGEVVYLPIDSKFPGDAYLNLLDAIESGDRTKIKNTTDQMKYAVIKAAKEIRNKYIYPPFTTEFAIMFLPFEGLYAEVLRLNLIEILQKDYRVNIAGPTTMAAMLNSFRMGFKSLALKQRSGEVWDTLEKVRTEFDKFNDVLISAQNRIDQTQHELEQLVGTRTRSIQRVLKNVSEITEESSDEYICNR